ncbi:alpha/beta-hydrolase [Agrocybe pediades]|nr:alpha/beta-hydrolase [Agrocybe pediades]
MLTLRLVLHVLLSFLSVSALPRVLSSPRPLVIWHGLGDSYSSPGMLEFASLIKEVHPGIYVHLVYLEEDIDKDRRAGFYGNVDQQVDFVAAQLASIPELQGGFDGIGFSQGGQFLRAFVERYNFPAVNNLITFGSQHMGISDIPGCRPYDFLCQVARRTAKQAVYGTWAQSNLVQAQYFRDPSNYEKYLSSNHFLTSINNEIPGSRNETYNRNLSSLNSLVLVLFTEDKTVVPKESSWFGAEAIQDLSNTHGLTNMEQIPLTAEAKLSSIVPMRQQPIYTENWIGLKELDERRGILFETCKGEHMQLGGCWKDLVAKFVGGRD